MHQKPAVPGRRRRSSSGGGRRQLGPRGEAGRRGGEAGRGAGLRGVHAGQAVRRDAQGGAAAVLLPSSVPSAQGGPVLADGVLHPGAAGGHRHHHRAVAAVPALVAGVPGVPGLPPLLQGLRRGWSGRPPR